jgi:four helix bundle protein
MGDFKQLEVWQLAHALGLDLYRATARFPQTERYAMSLQIRRAALSVVSNIAEGNGRMGDRECARFLRIARGSAAEIECQLLFARDLGHLPASTWSELDAATQRVSRMLVGLIRSIDQDR